MEQASNSLLYDVAVIGGGINGCGIALDLQGRGIKTALIEQGDIASATSSASSKLIHGGLRYLEYREFRLVRESLNEREVLLKKAPHLVKPMRFIMPHRPHLRPSWMIRIGLWLYDFLGKRDILPSSEYLKLDPASSVLDASISKAYEYSDCWVDDARLVALNAIDFVARGGDLKTYTQCIDAKVENGLWLLKLKDMITGESTTIHAKNLVNAAGPWADSFLENNAGVASDYSLKLIQGSHVVVPKIHQSDKAYILQNEDRRIVFVIPYLEKFSLIGTTDVLYQGDPGKVAITEQETQYLCDVVNEHFKHNISPSDVVWSYSGVRSICDDESESPQALTRDYTLETKQINGAAVVSVFGGKLTTYRKLSEAVAHKLQPFLPDMSPDWTSSSLLPGGDIVGDITSFTGSLQQQYPFLTAQSARRIAASYGSRCERFLSGAKQMQDLGVDFGHQFSEAELNYLIENECVKTAEDALWRRSKMGVFLNHSQQQAVSSYLNNKIAPQGMHNVQS